MKPRILFSLVILSIFFVNVGLLDSKASAITGNCYFSGAINGCGTAGPLPDYATNDLFKGRGADGTGSAIDISQLRTGNNSVNLASNKNYFINFINNRFSGTDVQDKTGAAYIMQKMLGTPVAKNSTNNVEWINRMNTPEITVEFKTNIPVTNTSYYDPTKEDIFTASTSVNRDVIEVWYLDPADGSNKRKAQIETNCGNLTASSVIPKGAWAIEPLITVSPVDTVAVGQPVVWTSKIKNNGPEATDAVISFKWRDVSPFNSGSTDTIGSSVPSGLAAGAISALYNSNYVAKASDADKYICRETFATPSSKVGDVINNTVVPSDMACVFVLGPPIPNDCRPIKFITSIPRTSVHSDESTKVVVTATNNTTGETKRYPTSGGYSISTKIDITTDCTTGDIWTIHESLLAGRGGSDHTYTYWHYNERHSSCSGTPSVCTYWTDHHDLTKTFETSKNIGPCYDYILQSSINNINYPKLEPGSSVSVLPSVSSQSYTHTADLPFWNTYHTQTHSKPTKWQISKMVIQPNGALPIAKAEGTGGSENYTPCSRFDPTNITTCTPSPIGNSVFDTSGDPASSINYNITVPDLAAGTKICFAFSIFPSRSDPDNKTSSWNNANVWYHAAFSPTANCFIIVKKPKTQIWGGDLQVGAGKSVISSTSVKSGRMFGSWVEYGIFAPVRITGTASGSAFAGTTGMSGSLICNYSKLTFTNADSSACSEGGTKGEYTSSHVIPQIEANFPGGVDITNSVIVVNSL